MDEWYYHVHFTREDVEAQQQQSGGLSVCLASGPGLITTVVGGLFLTPPAAGTDHPGSGSWAGAECGGLG